MIKDIKDGITGKILGIYIVFLNVLLIVIIAVIGLNGLLFPDYDTAEYWITELLKLLSGITGAVLIPVLIYKIMCRCFGLE